MAKKVAVLVVNPVNGAGLFQYLEAFFENGIQYRTFAVSETTHVKTNSGISIETDDVVVDVIPVIILPVTKVFGALNKTMLFNFKTLGAVAVTTAPDITISPTVSS